MSGYEFIKKCKNYNIEKSKGWKYETIVRWSLNAIERIERKKRNYKRYIPYKEWNWVLVEILGKSRRYFHNELFIRPSYFDEYFGNLERLKNIEKYKMSVHYLKTKLPDALILNIRSFL